jgi:RHS repeat-associated protein
MKRSQRAQRRSREDWRVLVDVWDGNVPLHEWVELTDPKAALEQDEPTLDANVIALLRRDAELGPQPAQAPPALLRADQGTKSAPITWLFEPESFAPLAKLVGDERHSIVTDHLGTPVSMLDAQGREVWASEIDTYGALRELRGERSACPFRWPGQYEDVETGLYYNRFRYYDAEAGQYVAQDPIGLLGGLGLHAYVHDPLAWVDPLGLTKSGGCGGNGDKLPTSRAARREAMRREGIPTSQQPISQSRNSSGREYRYETPRSGGGTEIKSVQQQTMDRSHPGQGHWEAGGVKVTDTGAVRLNDYGRPKLKNQKSKVDYDQ